MAFNIDTPTLEQIVLIVLAIIALVAAVAWLSHRRRQRSRTRWITDKLKQVVHFITRATYDECCSSF
jgi:Flp pilus assembly protein TadB